MSLSEGATCIDDGTLAAFVGGALEPSQIAVVEAHLAGCDSCLAIVAAAGSSSPALPPAAEATGEAILGRFEIGEFLARGGMGVVYHGLDRQTGQRVAIKCLEPELVDLLPEVVERFEREGDILRRLDHPNIVKMLGVSSHGQRRHIVMEYVAGGSLRALLRAHSRLPIERAVAIALELSDALSRAHHLGVIHRDIKPENILLSEDGTPRLSDFGLAKSSAVERALTESGVIVGTLAYQCPEALHGRKYDARADVWAFGVLLFEMLGGRRPFVAAHPAALLQAILHQPVPDLSALRPDAPSALIALIERMLAKDPEQRPASMRQIGAALEALGEARPAAAERAIERGALALTPDEPPWVGRAAELERLEQIAAECFAGRGRVVLVTGEAGAGKTALVEQLARRARRAAPELRIGVGHCFEHFGPSEAYAAFLEAVGNLLERDADRAFASSLERYAPTWCLQFPAHFSAPESREYLQRVTLGAGRERLLRELGDALVAFARVVPVCLRIEDLHWTDPASVDLLRLLCRRARESRVLVIATSRTDQVEAASPALSALIRENPAHGLYDEVCVGPLAPEHVQSYLEAAYAPNDFARELSLLVVRKTEGHALYATRLIQHLWEGGGIVKAGRGFRLKHPASELTLDIPESVRALIRSKMGSLGEPEQRILSAASVEGEEFTLAVLGPLLEMEERALEDELGRLCRQHRLVQPVGEEALANGALTLRYRFAHVLYQNVFYAELGPGRKRALHGAAALLLLAQQRAEGRSAVRIATHFERSGDAARAVDHWLVAGDQATQAYAYREALDCHSHALGLLAGVPLDTRSRRAANAHRKRAWACFHLLDTEAARREFERVLTLSRTLSDTGLEGETLNALAHMAIHAHTAGEMERHATEALRVAEAAGDEGVALVARAQLAGGRLWSEPGTEAMLEPIIQRARAIAHGPALALGLTFQGVAYDARSQHELAERSLTESLRYPTELREPLLTISVLLVIAGARAQLGRIGPALATYHEALDLSHRNAAAIGVLQALTRLSWLHRELGDARAAARFAAESGAASLDLPESTRGPRMVNNVHAMYSLFDAESNAVLCFGQRWRRAPLGDAASQAFALAEAWQARVSWWHWLLLVRLDAHRAQRALAHGDLDAAERHARATLERATRYGSAKYAAIAQRAVAEVACERGEFDHAAAELERGLAGLARAPNPLVAWKLEASLARVRLELDDAAGAREAYSRARTIIFDIARQIPEMSLRQAFLAATAEVVPGELTNPPEPALRRPAAG